MKSSWTSACRREMQPDQPGKVGEEKDGVRGRRAAAVADMEAAQILGRSGGDRPGTGRLLLERLLVQDDEAAVRRERGDRLPSRRREPSPSTSRLAVKTGSSRRRLRRCHLSAIRVTGNVEAQPRQPWPAGFRASARLPRVGDLDRRLSGPEEGQAERQQMNRISLGEGAAFRQAHFQRLLGADLHLHGPEGAEVDQADHLSRKRIGRAGRRPAPHPRPATQPSPDRRRRRAR